MTDNLELWHLVEKTPIEQTKAITGKSYSGTSPKPHYLVMKATEVFGPIGIGWGFRILDERIEEGANGDKMSLAHVLVWYKWKGETGEVSHIGGTQFSGQRNNGKFFTDEDAPKKSVTDALIKALSMIGFAGDIFMGRYDDSKYQDELREEAKVAKNELSREAYTMLETALRLATTRVELRLWAESNKIAIGRLPPDWQTDLRSEYTRHMESLPEGFTEEIAA